MDLQSIVIDHGEKELLRRVQGPMRFVAWFNLVCGGIITLSALVNLFVQPKMGIFMVLFAMMTLVLGGYTRAAALAFRAAGTDGAPLRLWDGIRSLGRLYSIMRWLIALELVIMAAILVVAVVKNL
jgi:hypothetical protein